MTDVTLVKNHNDKHTPMKAGDTLGTKGTTQHGIATKGATKWDS